MPPKHAHKPRAWGTRYDTLLSSPPTSPPHSTAQGATSAPHSPITHYKADSHNPASAATITNVPKAEKPRNDSSIFVGRYVSFCESCRCGGSYTRFSLPSNVDPEELARLLAQHLSEHPEILTVKAVADKKGGMCAFIQCRVSRKHPWLYIDSSMHICVVSRFTDVDGWL